MKEYSYALITFAIVSLFKLTSNQTTALDNKKCEFDMIDNVKYDLSKLRKESGDYTNTVGRYTYKANFCGPLYSKCVTMPNTPAAMFLRGNACINRYTTEWKPTAEYIDSMIKSKGIKLHCPEGDRCYLGVGNHKLSYVIGCDKNIELQFERIEKLTTCMIEYHFISKYACIEFAVTANSMLSLNSKTILAVIIISFSWYCIAFTYCNMKNNPEDGFMKNLPHREFWSNFFDYISHGFTTSVNYIKSKVSNDNASANSYI